MKNDNFPPFFHIVPVDKASACGLDGFGLYVVWVYAHQRDIDVFLSEADVYISLPQGGAGSDNIVGKVFLGCGEVFVFQLDTPSFFQAFVRLGGPATAQADGVQCAFGCVLFESMDNAVACSQQYDKHKDAPRHCKTGEERAQLVTLDCTVYFLPKVYHDYCK